MSLISLLSSGANEYEENVSAVFFNMLAMSSSIISTRRVTVLRDKLTFSNLPLLSGHNSPAVSIMHSFKNSPSEKGLPAFAILNASKKLALVLDF